MSRVRGLWGGGVLVVLFLAAIGGVLLSVGALGEDTWLDPRIRRQREKGGAKGAAKPRLLARMGRGLSPSGTPTPSPSPSPSFPPVAPARIGGLERAAFEEMNGGEEAAGAPLHKAEWSEEEVEDGWERYSDRFDHHLVLYQRLPKLSYNEFKAFNAFGHYQKKVLTYGFSAYKGGLHQLIAFHGIESGRIPHLRFFQFAAINPNHSAEELSAGWERYKTGSFHHMQEQDEFDEQREDL